MATAFCCANHVPTIKQILVTTARKYQCVA